MNSNPLHSVARQELTTMTFEHKALLFVLATFGIAWLSRPSLRNVRFHGFYRFFAWETILIMLLMNMNYWFVEPLGNRQIISWLFLIVSLVFIYQGVQLLRKQGEVSEDRDDPALLGIEKTTKLVTTGIYGYIRHPFYGSLLFLAWGTLLKRVSLPGIALGAATTILLILTAKHEEVENIQHFGGQYRDYMARTKMFIPFIF